MKDVLTNQFKAGAGKSVIYFPDKFLPQEGFTYIHDDLHARALIIQCNKAFAFISLELTSIPEEQIGKIKSAVNEVSGIAKEDIWILVTHSFSSPHFLPPFKWSDEGVKEKMKELENGILEAAKDAVKQALDALKPAKIGIGYSDCKINVNRDIQTAHGWWLGNNPEEASDKTLSVIRIDKDGAVLGDAPIAFLFHYGIQSSVMDGWSDNGKKPITTDIAGYASSYMEDIYNNQTVAMFAIGAAGDQAPVKKAVQTVVEKDGELSKVIRDDGFAIIQELGEILGESVIAASNKAEYFSMDKIISGKKVFECPSQKIPADIGSIRPSQNYEYEVEGTKEIEVEAVLLGKVVLCGVRPEINCVSGMELKSRVEHKDTLLFTMVNGGAKYMADKKSYQRHTYESINSFFAEGSAEITIANMIGLVNELLEYEKGHE